MENYMNSPFEREEEQPKHVSIKDKFDARNYLDTKLSDGENRREIKIRILPAMPGSNKISIPIHIHNLKVDNQIAQSGFKSYVCLNESRLDEHDPRGCPICNISKAHFEESKKYKEKSPQWKACCREGYKYEPKICYILRVIERGKENEGVKFWRFNKWDNGKGNMDQLQNLWHLRNKEALDAGIEGGYNLFDLHNGKDLILVLTKGENTDKVETTIMEAGFQTPLSNSEEQIQAWVNDTKSWRDMYAIKPYEYIDIVAKGEIPVFDQAKGRFISKKERDEAERKAAEQARQAIRNGGDTAPTPSAVQDKLPF